MSNIQKIISKNLLKKLFDQHIVLLGKTRSGKSSAMRNLVEDLLDDNLPVCVVDPKGDWWGLKASASGKRAGYPVVIFGGSHADVPLNARSGIAVAELAATGNRPCIIDLGGWMPGERTQFWIDFASTFFRLSKGRRWLAVDEVHNFCPKGKIMDPNAGKMLHWSNRLASEGLGKGISLIAASQRPQKVHNDFLTSCETLIGMRVIHKADRDALKDWIDGCGDLEKGKEVLTTIASNKRGEAWIWSPEAEYGPKRIQFPMFSTYDSFKPQNANQVKLKGWADVDLSEVKKKLEGAIKEAEANDPEKLKAEIRSLKGMLNARPTQPKEVQVTDAKAIERAVKQVQAQAGKQLAECDRVIGKLTERIRQAAIFLTSNLPKTVLKFEVDTPKIPAVETSKKEIPRVLSLRDGSDNRKILTPRLEPSSNSDVKLASGARRLLAALVSWHPNGMKEGQWRSHAGLKKSGTADTYKSALRSAGFIEQREGLFFATQAGVDHIGDQVQSAPTTTEEVLRLWEPKLASGARRILKVLVDAGGEPVSQEEITEKTGLQKSGTFDTYISALRTAQLALKHNSQYHANKETLFL